MDVHRFTYPRNEEPLVVNAINCCGLELLMSCNAARSRCFAVRGVVDGYVGTEVGLSSHHWPTYHQTLLTAKYHHVESCQ